MSKDIDELLKSYPNYFISTRENFYNKKKEKYDKAIEKYFIKLSIERRKEISKKERNEIFFNIQRTLNYPAIPTYFCNNRELHMFKGFKFSQVGKISQIGKKMIYFKTRLFWEEYDSNIFYWNQIGEISPAPDCLEIGLMSQLSFRGVHYFMCRLLKVEKIK